jgi:hypothetical protein
MHGRDDSNKEIEPDAIALLQSGSDGLGADARNPHMALRVVRKLIVHVVRELAVNADRLQLVKHGVA